MQFLFSRFPDSVGTPETMWTIVVGEMVRFLSLGRMKVDSTSKGHLTIDIGFNLLLEQRSVIVGVGERSLFYLSFDGALVGYKRLDFMPMSFCVYRVSESAFSPPKTHVLMSTDKGNLVIYWGTQLIWSAKIDSENLVAIQVVTIDHLKGVILTLDENGRLTANYLGTYPSLQLPFSTSVRSISVFIFKSILF